MEFLHIRQRKRVIVIYPIHVESLPFCALTQDGTRIEIISGHHRIRSGKDAGIQEFYIILDVSGLNRSKITAKQIAHNAISGFDDQSTLKELSKFLDDVDDMIESYAGKDILAELNGSIDKYLSPVMSFDWKNIALMFLPHQIADLDKLVEVTKRMSLDYVGISGIDEYKPFIEALAKYQSFADVKNIGAAVHAMSKLTLQVMSEVGYTGEEEWVQLTSLFGSGAVSQETAEIIAKAITKAVEAKEINAKNKLEFLRILCERYLGD